MKKVLATYLSGLQLESLFLKLIKIEINCYNWRAGS